MFFKNTRSLDFFWVIPAQAVREARVNWTKLGIPTPAERRPWRNGTLLEFYYSNAETPNRYIKRTVKFRKLVTLREGSGARCTTVPGGQIRTYKLTNMFFDRGHHLS